MTATRGSTIVIVEDSPAVQELFEQALRQLDNCVLITQNPLEVVDVARRVRIDLLVTTPDSRPGIVEQMRVSQPELRVLYLSNDADGLQPGSEGAATLRTPFSLDELRTAIEALLDRSPDASVEAGTGL